MRNYSLQPMGDYTNYGYQTFPAALNVFSLILFLL